MSVTAELPYKMDSRVYQLSIFYLKVYLPGF